MSRNATRFAVPYRVLAVLALSLVVLTGGGCRFMSAFNKHEDPLVKPVITKMPRLAYTDVDASGRKLAAADLKVMVRRPELTVKKRSGAVAFVIPETVQPFQPSHWNHLIAEQDPPAGAAVPPGSTVTLTLGVHHGAGPFRPWLEAHGGAVKSRGEQRCRDCHAEKSCSDCHERVRL